VDEEDLIFWQDILDEVAAGRIAGHGCPFCREGQIAVERSERGRTRLSCPKCNKFIEGTIGSHDQA
jgi:hypothetical protein